MSRENKQLVVSAVFLSMIPTAVLISAKITTILGFSFTVGAYAYAVTFPCTDIIGECFGKKEAKQLVYFGFLGYLFCIIFSVIAVLSPPAEFWQANQESYRAFFGIVPRIVLGSILAYLVSQIHDVWAFDYWKRKTRSRWLWVRNNLSTVTSQLIDTVIFVSIGLGGSVPADQIPSLILGQYLLKIAIAAVDTPIVYLGVRWINSATVDVPERLDHVYDPCYKDKIK